MVAFSILVGHISTAQSFSCKRLSNLAVGLVKMVVLRALLKIRVLREGARVHRLRWSWRSIIGVKKTRES